MAEKTNMTTQEKILSSQRKCYRETLIGEITVPANQTSMLEIKISSLGAFAVKEITGGFECLVDNAGTIVDNGVCGLGVQISDGANSLPITNDFVSLDLVLTPGHMRSANATNNLTTAPAGGFMFSPWKFEYTFGALSSIQMQVRNSSNTENKMKIAFHGLRVRG